MISSNLTRRESVARTEGHVESKRRLKVRGHADGRKAYIDPEEEPLYRSKGENSLNRKIGPFVNSSYEA